MCKVSISHPEVSLWSPRATFWSIHISDMVLSLLTLLRGDNSETERNRLWLSWVCHIVVQLGQARRGWNKLCESRKWHSVVRIRRIGGLCLLNPPDFIQLHQARECNSVARYWHRAVFLPPVSNWSLENYHKHVQNITFIYKNFSVGKNSRYPGYSPVVDLRPQRCEALSLILRPIK